MSFLSHLECSRCHQTHDADRLQNLCTCGGPLLVRYDLKAAARAVRPQGSRRPRVLHVALPRGAAAAR